MESKSIFTSKTFWINVLMAAASILDMQYFGNMIPENIKALIVLGVNTVLRIISSNQPTSIIASKGWLGMLTEDAPVVAPPAVSIAPALEPAIYAAGASSGVAMNVPVGDVAVSIRDSIAKVCSVIPEGKNTALVARVDLAGANVILARRFENGWQADAFFGKTWKGGVQAGFELMKSW